MENEKVLELLKIIYVFSSIKNKYIKWEIHRVNFLWHHRHLENHLLPDSNDGGGSMGQCWHGGSGSQLILFELT